ncbi:response regulator [Acanthopleuribacter pedis]|uniref:histidine kinase n=1 Tax=Acanthopleuribacter pedis TaxID=442870 RepID=A0A8J7QGR8_9BACT|nr:response regulator [Acanthopleuribacter pedis]MBO1322035.1 response regulator [Acanthopleuribacter pedis]
MKNVLIVDDSRVCRRMYAKELGRAGYQTFEAKDGLEALHLVKEQEIDLVVLDVEMPNMNGYETCEHLRSEEFSAHFGKADKLHDVLPVVFVTSHKSLEGRVKSFNKGATDFITKGFKPGTLADTINRILKPISPLMGLTALVVDDSKFIRNMLSSCLKEQGLNVLEAVDGNDAFDLLCERSEGVDMVITDLEMPGMNGDILCRKIRRELGMRGIPVIILTARDEQKGLLGLFQAGATDYLIKPFARDELIARLKVSVEVKREARREVVQAEKNQTSEQKKLVEAHAKAADQAEVATAILHNVANLLNSVSVSCNQVRAQINDSRIKQLLLANHLIEENLTDLPRYLSEDPRGRMLPDYLLQLGERLEGERVAVAQEIEAISAKIEIMKSAVFSQQSYAKGKELLERFSLAELVEEVLLIQNALIEKAGVVVGTEFNVHQPVVLPKSKVTHILINLIKNAVEAMADSEPRLLTIQLFRVDGDVTLTITDTGVGLSPENLKKMFTHGFTTKETGHGFGLAYCKRAMDEMGGQLTVHSDGPGLGTSFAMTFSRVENER